jgi:hypothetical protein
VTLDNYSTVHITTQRGPVAVRIRVRLYSRAFLGPLTLSLAKLGMSAQTGKYQVKQSHNHIFLNQECRNPL